MDPVRTPTAAFRSRARRFWLNVHLSIALVVGAVIAVLGVSGAALVLKGPLIRHDFGAAAFALPASASSEAVLGASQVRAPVDDWIAQARSRFPQLRAIVSVTAPGASPLPTEAALLTAVLDDGGYGFVTVDPVSAKPLGFFRYGEGWMFGLLEFHRHLLLPEMLEEIGESVVAWSGVFLLVSIGSGLFLWWPRRNGWRDAFVIRRRGRFWRSMHTSVAALAAVPLVLLAASGVMLAKPEWFVVPAAVPVIAASAGDMSCNLPVGYQAAVAAALRAARSNDFISVAALPENGGYMVQLKLSQAELSGAASTMVKVDGACGRVTVLPSRRAQRSPAAQETHARLLLGWPGQVLVFCAGLALPFLYGTGLRLWWQRRAARKAGR